MTAREKEAPEPKTPDAKRYRLTKKSEDPVWPYPMQAAMGADSPGVLADAVADAAPKQKDEFERDILEIKNMQDYHSSRLVAMHRRLPMKAPPSKRPVHRAEEEDEAPEPKRRQKTLIGGRGTVAWDTRRDDEDEAASSAEVPPLLAAVVCLGATRLPHGGPNSFPGV